MQIDYALILSAGLGTRMGEIGRCIPKVMWPILDTPIIDLQISYCKSLGIKKIFINTHCLAKVIEEHIVNKYQDQVILLREDPLLDSGGAIHNLARHQDVQYSGNLLMVNGDQFLIFNKELIFSSLDKLKDSRAVLFGINVDKSEKYSETIIVNDMLTSIAPQDGTKDFITYSGLGIINLNGLKPVLGSSKFFQSVADYKSEKIMMIIPPVFEYWDFGTASIYANNILKFNSISFEQSNFKKFLETFGVNLKEKEKYTNFSNRAIRLTLDSDFVDNSISRNDVIVKY